MMFLLSNKAYNQAHMSIDENLLTVSILHLDFLLKIDMFN